MKDILKLMDKDHEELVALFDQFLSHIKNNSDQSVEAFFQFSQNIQKHFQ